MNTLLVQVRDAARGGKETGNLNRREAGEEGGKIAVDLTSQGGNELHDLHDVAHLHVQLLEHVAAQVLNLI